MVEPNEIPLIKTTSNKSSLHKDLIETFFDATKSSATKRLPKLQMQMKLQEDIAYLRVFGAR